MNQQVKEISVLRQAGTLILLKHPDKKGRELVREIEIKAPCLFVLDRIAEQLCDMTDDFASLDWTESIKSSIIYSHKNAKRAARIIAIAQLGIEHEDTRKLNELTRFYYRTLTPVALGEFLTVILSTMELEDFLRSTSLMLVKRGQLVGETDSSPLQDLGLQYASASDGRTNILPKK